MEALRFSVHIFIVLFEQIEKIPRILISVSGFIFFCGFLQVNI